MHRAWLLPSFAVMVLAGTGIGLQLGRSAASEIDPVYFSGSYEGRSFASLTPQGVPELSDEPLSDPQPIRPGDYGSGCIRCPNPVGVPRRNDGVFRQAAADSYIGRSEPIDVPAALPEFAVVAVQDRELIEAYSRYPITPEEQRRHEAAAQAAIAGAIPELALPLDVEPADPRIPSEPTGL